MIYCKITKGKNVIINTRKNTRKKLVEGGKILKNSIKTLAVWLIIGIILVAPLS